MKHLILFLFALSFAACSSDPDAPEITFPQCIDDEIPVFETRACFGSGDLTKWNLAGEDVYCFNEGTCINDAEALIYDEQCNLICVLGGIDGNEICDGINWPDNASLIGVIYRY